MEQCFRRFLRSQEGFCTKAAKASLEILSKGFQGIVHLRNKAYDKGIFRSDRPHNTFIISIGNIQAGGAGKTPFTILLAKSLLPTKTAILTRGYKAKKCNKHSFIVEEQDKVNARLVGDEPALLAQSLSESMIIIGKNRLESAKLAASHHIPVMILDDGFQHRALQRDVDIVLIDASLHQEEMHLFPRGLLRELPSALSRAHLVVINRSKDLQQYQTLKHQYSSVTQAPIIGVELKLTRILGDCATLGKSLSFRKGALFCGIANPQSFVDVVQKLDVNIVAQYISSDHSQYTWKCLYEAASDAKMKGAEFLICTEKDAVKVSQWASQLPLPVVWTQMDMQVIHDNDIWEHWIKDLKKKANGCI